MKVYERIDLLSRKKPIIFKIVFSRFAMIVVLLVIEIAVLAAVYLKMRDYFEIFNILQTLLILCLITFLFNCSMDASAKLTWLFLIMLFPIPATIFLWFTQTDFGHRLVKKRMAKLIGDTKTLIPQDMEVFESEELRESGTDDLCRYLNHNGNFPVYANTEVKYLPSGQEMFHELMQELEKAEKFIFMEYFIIDEGYMWGSILKILADKAKEGVDVRVMYDGMCEAVLLPHDYPVRMAKLGIKCQPFTPISPFISTQYNYRDHRKICVIDGKVGFTGGINLADEYINRIERHGHWKDVAIMLKGDAVRSFTLMFLQMWNISENELDWSPVDVSYNADNPSGYVLPYADCPLDGDKVGESVYMDILYRARSYVHIMTPYLILDNELERALTYAAQRGVEVSIILPGIPDKIAAYALAKSHYKSLLAAGVKIYEYIPGFVHAKVFVSDDEKAVVGSINLDYRSLYHHFECAAYMYRTSCIVDIEEDFQNTLKKCREVTKETVKKEKFGYKVLGLILKILAPLM